MTDLETLFHEYLPSLFIFLCSFLSLVLSIFGHCLHLVLGKCELQLHAGTRGPLDYVEFPSLLLEKYSIPLSLNIYLNIAISISLNIYLSQYLSTSISQYLSLKYLSPNIYLSNIYIPNIYLSKIYIPNIYLSKIYHYLSLNAYLSQVYVERRGSADVC
jgi:hypothetical protein